MVLRWIDGVHSQDVGVDLLQVRDIPPASIAVGQWVSVGGVGTGGAIGRVVLLVCNTPEVAEALLALVPAFERSLGIQLRTVVRVEEVLSIDLNLRNVIVTCRRNTTQ